MEQTAKILGGVAVIADKLTDTYPQIEEGMKEPKYLIIGSMARMLLTGADYCIDNKGNRIEIPKVSREILNDSVRKIGDIDILSFSEPGIYLNRDRLKFWSQNRPVLEGISKEAYCCVKEPNSNYDIKIQPSVLYSKKLYVKVNIKGKDYYIQGLDLLLAYNTLFTVRSYNYINSEIDRGKCQKDFDVLFEAAKQMYSIDQLKMTTYELLCFYKEMIRSENLSANLLELMRDVHANHNMKNFVKDILKDDVYKMFNIYFPEEQNDRDEVNKLKALKDTANIVDLSRSNDKTL